MFLKKLRRELIVSKLAGKRILSFKILFCQTAVFVVRIIVHQTTQCLAFQGVGEPCPAIINNKNRRKGTLRACGHFGSSKGHKFSQPHHHQRIEKWLKDMAITNVLQAGGAIDYYESEGRLPRRPWIFWGVGLS